jgi:hypothetical protein
MESSKQITYLSASTPKKRKVTERPRWTSGISIEQQQKLLSSQTNTPQKQQMMQQLSTKRNGYKYQDQKKGLYHPTKFVSLQHIVDLLLASNLLCYYCHYPVDLFYETVRDRTQWTLDRIYNEFGHNYDNVIIACLECNLHRKTIQHQKFKTTCDWIEIIKCDAPPEEQV